MKDASGCLRWIALVGLALLAGACGPAEPEGEATETPILLPAFATVGPTQQVGPQPATPSETEGEEVLGRRVRIGDVSLKVPRGWFWTQVTFEHLDSLIFTAQDPDELQAFDDPDLALPMDFMAGALIVTAASEVVDSVAWQQQAAESYNELDEGDLEAMLLAMDQVGLVNFAAVETVSLQSASLETLAGQFALKLEGEVGFTDDTPPRLHVAVWLCRVEDRFLGYYAMASEEVWPTSEALFAAVAETIRLR